MTKLMAITLAILAPILLVGASNAGRSQDAKSIAIDATHASITKYESDTDLQRRREVLIHRAERSLERVKLQERRAEAKARAEAQARRERQAEAEAATRAQAQQETSVARSVSSGSVWDRLAQCESGGNWSYNGSSGYDGGLQFLPSTWTGVKPSGYPDYAWQATREQQIAAAEILLQSSGWGAWPACSAELGL